MVLEPRVAFRKFGGVLLMGRNPAIAFAKKANEVGAALVNLVQADGEHVALLRLLRRNAPSQVDVDEFDEPASKSDSERGKHLLHEQLALFVEVPEGAGEEQANSTRIRAQL